MGKIHMVLEDWNGCLLDDVPHRFEHGPCAIFRHYGLPKPTLEDYCQHITSDFMLWYYARGVPNSGDKKKDGDTLNAIMKANMATADIPPLFPETRSFLQAVWSASMVQTLTSAMEETEFRRQFEHHKLGRFFREIQGGVRGKAPVFLKLLELYGVSPDHAVGVTDTMSDAKELAAVGVRPIIIPRGYSVPDMVAVPTLIIAKDLNEALTHILGQ